MYRTKTISHYLKDVASKSPAPGGGSVAALTGALAASLATMVSRYSASKNSKKTKVISKDLSCIAKKLQRLIDDDIVAYKKVSLALKLSKMTPNKKRLKEMKLQTALKKAAAVPYEVATLCYRGLVLTHRLVKIGNKNLISDTAMSALLFAAAYESALYNVWINLKNIRNRRFVYSITKDVAALTSKVESLEKDTISKVSKFL